MSTQGIPAVMRFTVLAAALAATLSGCGYDYLQHTDRVGYATGDAVKANLESETVDPSNGAMYRTDGLGKTGPVIPKDQATATNTAQTGNTP